MKKLNLKEKIKKFENFGIGNKELLHYASSLSFHTILSLLPILMISLSVFTSMPSFNVYYTKIKNFIFSNLLPTNQEVIRTYLDQFLNNSISLGLIGFVGVIITSLLFFIDYEMIISKITLCKSRKFFSSLSTYWTLLTLAPIGLGASFYASSILQNLLNKYEFTSWINILSLLPFLIIWAILAVTYAASINKEISSKNIIISSLISSIFWSISKVAFVEYALYNKTYLSIYGSFSVALFFFLWIYIGWIIFLYGVKICGYLDQNDRQDPDNGQNNSENFIFNSQN